MDFEVESGSVSIELWKILLRRMSLRQKLICRQLCRTLRDIIDKDFRPTTLGIALLMQKRTFKNNFRVHPFHQDAGERENPTNTRPIIWKGPNRRDFVDCFPEDDFSAEFFRHSFYHNLKVVCIGEGNHSLNRCMFDARLLQYLPLLRNLQLYNCNPRNTYETSLPNLKRFTLMYTEWENVFATCPKVEKFQCSLEDFQIFSEEYEERDLSQILIYLETFVLHTDGHVVGDEIAAVRSYFPWLKKLTLVTSSKRFCNNFPVFDSLRVLHVKYFNCWQAHFPHRFKRFVKIANRLQSLYRNKPTVIYLNGLNVNLYREEERRFFFNCHLFADDALADYEFDRYRVDRARSTVLNIVAWRETVYPAIAILRLPPFLYRIYIKPPIEQEQLDRLPLDVPNLSILSLGEFKNVENKMELECEEEDSDPEVDNYRLESQQSLRNRPDSQQSLRYRPESQQSLRYRPESQQSLRYRPGSFRSDSCRSDSLRSDSYPSDSYRSDSYQSESLPSGSSRSTGTDEDWETQSTMSYKRSAQALRGPAYRLEFLLRLNNLTSLCLGDIGYHPNLPYLLIQAIYSLKHLVQLELRHVDFSPAACCAIHESITVKASRMPYYRFHLWFSPLNLWPVYPDILNVFTSFLEI